MVENRNKLFNYVLVFLLIASSTFPFFRGAIGTYSLVGLSIYIVKDIFNYAFSLRYLLCVIVISIYQFCYFAPNYEFAILREDIVGFVIALLVVMELKFKFILIYIRIIYIITIVSLGVYGIFLVAPDVIRGFANSSPDFFKFTYKNYNVPIKMVNPVFFNFSYHLFEEYRNNGPAWEPTVFAALLNTALIFNYLQFKTIINRYGCVFIIGLITTLSTTGYIAFFILLLSFFVLSTKIKLITKVLSLGFILCIAIFTYNSLPFLGQKIADEYENIDNDAYDRGGDSRMASALMDYREMTEKSIYFILGKGEDKANRIKGMDKRVLRNNGFTGLLIEKGLLVSIIYLSLLYFTFYWLCKVHGINTLFSIFFTIMIVGLSFSEILFDLPLFHAFTFLGLVLFELDKKQILRKRLQSSPL